GRIDCDERAGDERDRQEDSDHRSDRPPATPNDIDRRVPNQGHSDFLPLTTPVNGPHRIVSSEDRPEARPSEPRNPSDTVRAGRARAARGQARVLLNPIVVHLAPAGVTPSFPPQTCDSARAM